MSNKSTPREHLGTVSRQWAAKSYSSHDGRASSSLSSDQSGISPVGSKVGVGSRQLTDAFSRIDQKRLQGRTPVKSRPFTQKVEG